MEIYFVRHGKTEWNVEGRVQGYHGDSPLIPEAIEDVTLLGQALSDVKFDYVFSSDLARAKRTAEIIQTENLTACPLSLSKELREWQLGKLEGAKIQTVNAIYPKQMTAFKHNLAKFNSQMFEAESVYHATRRLENFVKGLKKLDAERVLIVSHGAFLTAGIKHLLNTAPALLRQDGGLKNGSVSILQTENFEQFNLTLWNAQPHLTEMDIASVS